MRPDGGVVWASSHVTLVRDDVGDPQYFFVQLEDITARKQLEGDLAHQALHDSLTGLANRALLTDRLVHGLAGSRRRGSQLGVLFLNVDHFKSVNESFGQAAGDELLRHAARRIAASIRPGDTVGRVGGDEFVVVCDGGSTLETSALAERVLTSLTQECVVGGQTLRFGASIGIAIADDEATPENLLRDAVRGDVPRQGAGPRRGGTVRPGAPVHRGATRGHGLRAAAARSSAASSPCTTNPSSTSRPGRW